MKTYNVVITKRCYAKIRGNSEQDVKNIGFELYDPSCYDDETIENVECLGESSLYDDEFDDIDYNEFSYEDEQEDY